MVQKLGTLLLFVAIGLAAILPKASAAGGEEKEEVDPPDPAHGFGDKEEDIKEISKDIEKMGTSEIGPDDYDEDNTKAHPSNPDASTEPSQPLEEPASGSNKFRRHLAQPGAEREEALENVDPKDLEPQTYEYNYEEPTMDQGRSSSSRPKPRIEPNANSLGKSIYIIYTPVIFTSSFIMTIM